MKTKLYFKGIAVMCVGCLMSSCTRTATWRQIRNNPQKYMQEEVCIRGGVVRVEWNTQEKHGDIILRDRNHDTGPVRFCIRKNWRGPGMKVVVLGKVQQEQRDMGS